MEEVEIVRYLLNGIIIAGFIGMFWYIFNDPNH